MELNKRMTKGETVYGVIGIALLAVILPLLALPFKLLIDSLFKIDLTDIQLELIYSYLLFFYIVIGMRKFLKLELGKLADKPGRAVSSIIFGYALYFAAAILINGVVDLSGLEGLQNPNAEMNLEFLMRNPREFIVTAVLLMPLVEETLFRGVIFGKLSGRKWLAYTVSTLVFALMHVYQYAIVFMDARYLIFALSYVPYGVATAYIYSRSGSIWSSVFFHMLMNGWSVYVLAGLT